MSSHRKTNSFGKSRRWRLWLAGLLGCAAVGCGGNKPAFLASAKPPPPPAESLVLRGEGFVAEKTPEPGSPEAKLAGAREFFRQGKYDEACDTYDDLTNRKKFSDTIVMEALFGEAESLRLQGHYPKAADTYTRLLREFPNTPYKEQSVQHMYEIADYWLDDTRHQMKEAREKRDGKRWFVAPNFFHWDKTKPFTDEEGRAVEKLEQVHYNDIKGDLGLGDKALFLAGSVQFFNENFSEADHFFSQVHKHYPNSSVAPKAVELAIISKHMSTGGADYDGRKVAEARVLVDSALRDYPELAREKSEFLNRQLIGITMQQAEKEFKMAEFYRRRGKDGSAYFYYELVCRCYPNTKFAQLASQAKQELEAKAQKEGKPILPPESGPGQPAATPPVELAPQPRPVPQPPEIGPPPRPLPPLDR